MQALIRIAIAGGALWLLSRAFSGRLGGASRVKVSESAIRDEAAKARNAGLPGLIVRVKVGDGGTVTYEGSASAVLGESVQLEVTAADGSVAILEGEELRSQAVPLEFLAVESSRRGEAIAALGAPVIRNGGKLVFGA